MQMKPTGKTDQRRREEERVQCRLWWLAVVKAVARKLGGGRCNASSFSV